MSESGTTPIKHRYLRSNSDWPVDYYQASAGQDEALCYVRLSLADIPHMDLHMELWIIYESICDLSRNSRHFFSQTSWVVCRRNPNLLHKYWRKHWRPSRLPLRDARCTMYDSCGFRCIVRHKLFPRWKEQNLTVVAPQTP